MKKKIVLFMIVFAGILITSCVNLNNPPTKPNNPVPADKSIDVSISPTLSWNASDPDNDKLVYKLYLSKTPNPSLYTDGIISNSINVGPLDYETNYYWRVEAIDGKGGKSLSPIWTLKLLN